MGVSSRSGSKGGVWVGAKHIPRGGLWLRRGQRLSLFVLLSTSPWLDGWVDKRRRWWRVVVVNQQKTKEGAGRRVGIASLQREGAKVQRRIYAYPHRCLSTTHIHTRSMLRRPELLDWNTNRCTRPKSQLLSGCVLGQHLQCSGHEWAGAAPPGCGLSIKRTW